MKLIYIALSTFLLFSYSASKRIKRVKLDDSVDLVTALSSFQNTGTPYASPACWINGIQQIEEFVHKGSTLQQEYSSYSGTSFCSTMTAQIRKILAFRTAQCYVEGETKRKFASEKDTTNTKNENSKMEEITFDNEGLEQSLDEITESIDEVLSNLDDGHYTVYTSFYLHIHDICVQLSQEMWNNQIEKATSDLVKSAKDIPGEIDSVLGDFYISISEKEAIANQKRMQDLENFFSANVSFCYSRLLLRK